MKAAVVNTENNGIPQHRERTYIIAYRQFKNRKFRFPRKLPKNHHVHWNKIFQRKNKHGSSLALVNDSAKARISEALNAVSKARLKGPVFIDVESSDQFKHWKTNCSPCITKSRATSGGYYISTLERRMTTTEMARLQGFGSWPIDQYKIHCSKTKINGAIGNAMSCNVLERILPRAFWACGLINHIPSDPWENKKYVVSGKAIEDVGHVDLDVSN